MLPRTMAEILHVYRSMHILNGQEIVVMPKKMEHTADHYTAMCVGVTSTGELMVRVDGKERLLSFEEVSVRPRVNRLL